ncbi:DUF5803 family protein [Natronomonas sp.]|uniref:DUF5803 family protein n=1 Tax=Natronomonas sp. TaxID=2184060 RepID=UPI00261AFBD4|nr:DUF5803 family protein [Natronomonas sp.]
MNRRLLAALAFVLVAGSAGCTGVFGTDVGDPEALSADADYEYDTEYDANIAIDRNEYTAVYNVSAKVTGGEGTMQLWRTNRLTVEQPLEISALQFRYPNGTIVRYVDGEAVRIAGDGTEEPTDSLAVDNTRRRTVVELPAEEGQLAFTAPKSGKQLTVYTPVHGSYDVALPPETDAALPLLSRVQPSNDDRQRVDDRVHLRWDSVETSVVVVRWYLDRDLWLFGGLAAIAGLIGVVGAAYYYRQIRSATERRESEGFDIGESGDDEGPPPGMR